MLPLRVRLSNSLPLAISSWLHAPRKFSPLKTSPLSLVLVLLVLLLILLPHSPIPPMPRSSGVTVAIFHTSFKALAFKVAAPRRAAHERQKLHKLSIQRSQKMKIRNIISLRYHNILLRSFIFILVCILMAFIISCSEKVSTIKK